MSELSERERQALGRANLSVHIFAAQMRLFASAVRRANEVAAAFILAAAPPSGGQPNE